MKRGRENAGEEPEHLFGRTFEYRSRVIRVDVWYDYSSDYRTINVAVASDSRAFGSRWDRYGVFELHDSYNVSGQDLTPHIRQIVNKAKDQIDRADAKNPEAEWEAVKEEVLTNE